MSKMEAVKGYIEEIRDTIGLWEFSVILILTGVLLLVSFILHSRDANVPFTLSAYRLNPYTVDVPATYYGYPLEMIAFFRPDAYVREQMMKDGYSLFQIVWPGLILNFVMFFGLAFAIMYLYRRHSG